MPQNNNKVRKFQRIFLSKIQGEQAPAKVSEAALEQSMNGNKPSRKRGRPGYKDKGIDYPYKKTSMMIDKELYDKVRLIASQNSLNISDISNAALRLYINAYEKKNGEIVVDTKKGVKADNLI